MSEENAGTNPEPFQSAESVVDNILSRDEGSNTGDTSDEAGNQTTNDGEANTAAEAGAEDKQGEVAGTKPVEADKAKEEAKFELPKQQDKDYSKEVKAHYAKKFGTTLEEAAKNPSLMSAIKTNIDNDIYVQQLKAKDEEKSKAEADAAKTAEEKKTTDAKSAEAGAKPTTQEYLAQLEKDAESVNDPELAAAFKSGIWKAFSGADVNDPEVAKQLKERGIDVDAPVKVLTEFGLNLARTAANAAVEKERALFDQRIEERYPGFAQMYWNVVEGQAWDGIKNSDESYKALPDYGSPDFMKMVDDAVEKNDWIKNITMPGKSQAEVTQAKLAIIARIAGGERVKPTDIAEAAEVARRQGADAERKKARGNLDSGRTAGNAGAGKSGEVSDIVAEYLSRNKGL